MIAVRSALVGTLSLSDKDGGNEFAQIELSVDRYVREWALGAYELLHADVSKFVALEVQVQVNFCLLR